VGALIVPSFSHLEKWMKRNNIPYTSHEEAVKNPLVLDKYKEIIEGLNASFNHVEQVKKFELLPREWSIETGEMTPKLSLKRKVIMEKYKDAIEHIYAGA
jgi:long-chain acyl-CoA synthetase